MRRPARRTGRETNTMPSARHERGLGSFSTPQEGKPSTENRRLSVPPTMRGLSWFSWHRITERTQQANVGFTLLPTDVVHEQMLDKIPREVL